MAAANQAFQKYKNASVMTASKERLLIMMYDGLVQKLQLAAEALRREQATEAHMQLVKCQNIILELKNSLKMEYDISHSLSQLYDYYYRRLVEANVNKSIEPVQEVLPAIEGLRSTWMKAAIKVKEEKEKLTERL